MDMTPTDVAWADSLIWLATVIVAAGTVGGALRFLGRRLGWVKDLRDDLMGEPPRPGVPARPGVMERLELLTAEVHRQGQQIAEVHHEVHPNGGGSIKDQMTRVEASQQRTESGVADLSRRMDASEADRAALHVVVDRLVLPGAGDDSPR